MHSVILGPYRVRYYRGRISNFDQSEARKHCFLASDWLKFVTLPRKYRALFIVISVVSDVLLGHLGRISGFFGRSSSSVKVKV